MSGLLIDGKLHDVPGVDVISPEQFPWARLSQLDFRARQTSWVRQLTIHTTKGISKQYVRAGRGAGGKDKAVADFWRGDPHHSAAPLIVDNDGSVVCLCDLLKVEAFHATTVNTWSVGIEMYQEPDGSIYEAVLDSTVKLVLRLCDLLGIPLQGEARPYKEGAIIERLLHGGKDAVGVFGHRDNAWDFNHNASARGRGDPGDQIFLRLRAAGMLLHRYDDKPIPGDRAYWAKVQDGLNKRYGINIGTDGVCGPETVRTLRKYGLWNGGVFTSPPV
ncbi:MAG TPA: N-acetylmuramoyl-L-alanine amidase [Gemmatimonadaceae bacterium]